MVLRIALFTAVSSLAAGCVVTDELDGALDDTRGMDMLDIVGGSDANITDYPWQISLQSAAGGHFCGGSVLSASWVLTAQHCVVGESPTSVRIAAGMSNLSAATSQGQVRGAVEIIRYPGYTSVSSGKDVALIRLATPLDLSLPGIEAIPLVTPEDATAGLMDPGVISTVTGWGSLSSGGASPDRLQAVDVPLVSHADASAAYASQGYSLTEDQLAAGVMGVGGKDSCQGDSGGPLVVPDGSGNAKLGGVVSWGTGCAEPDYPGMYARVSSFAPWITGIVNSTLLTVLQESGLAGSQNAFIHYPVLVPEGALTFTVNMAGGTGDADLYVKYGSQPTTTSYDCRPYRSGNTEACSFDVPQAGTWYVSVRAYSSYTGVTLTAGYRASGTTPATELCNDGADNDGDGAADCADNDCASHPACQPVEACDDGADNDGDGAADCADSDCASHPACQSACPGGTLTGALSSAEPSAVFAYSSAATGVYEAELSGDAGTNFDLFLEYQRGTRWRRAAGSQNSNSSELISYTSPSAELYRWRVQRVSGTGAFALCVASPQ